LTATRGDKFGDAGFSPMNDTFFTPVANATTLPALPAIASAFFADTKGAADVAIITARTTIRNLKGAIVVALNNAIAIGGNLVEDGRMNGFHASGINPDLRTESCFPVS